MSVKRLRFVNIFDNGQRLTSKINFHKSFIWNRLRSCTHHPMLTINGIQGTLRRWQISTKIHINWTRYGGSHVAPPQPNPFACVCVRARSVHNINDFVGIFRSFRSFASTVDWTSRGHHHCDPRPILFWMCIFLSFSPSSPLFLSFSFLQYIYLCVRLRQYFMTKQISVRFISCFILHFWCLLAARRELFANDRTI